MNLSKNGLDLIKSFESLSLKSYKDIAGIWTIGYGHAISINHKDIDENTVITRDKAEKLLDSDTQIACLIIESAIKVNLTQNQFDALVSFVFNCGETALKKSIASYINNGLLDKAADTMLLYNKTHKIINGVKVFTVSKGLTNRRIAEVNLFKK